MDDLISRQEVLDSINYVMADYIPFLYGEFDKIPLDIKRAILKVPSVQPEQKWIPCNKKLPLEYETVLITGKMKYASDKEYEYFVDCAFVGSLHGTPDNFSPFDFETWNDWYEGQEEYYILAWMPFPEPYKEEGE